MKEELIDKNLILDHIDYLLKKYPKNYYLLVLVDFINSLNTKEKEVDLEKELENWLGDRVGKWKGDECEKMCRYFFNLGLKSKK